MKKTLLYSALACVTAFGLQSCLDFDDPGSELSQSQTTADTEVHQGGADTINYRRIITAEEFTAAQKELRTYTNQCRTGVYNMRGGKEGGTPASHSYQFQYNLDVDNYVQYFVTTHKDFPYSNAILTSTYNISERFNGAAHGGYNLAKVVFAPFLNHPLANDMPEVKAIYLLYYNLIAQENADISGPFTYTEDKTNSQDPQKYEPLRDIYYGIKANVDTVLACLNYYEENRDEDYKKALKKFLFSNEADGLAMYLYGKDADIDRYIRLANSLKLRMAMRIVKVEPETARQWAEEAVKGGVIEEMYQQQGVMPGVIGFTHPLVEIANSWNDTRISASFESLLMSLDHPYTKYLLKNNSADIASLVKKDADGNALVNLEANSGIVGIRSGSLVGDGQNVSTNPFIAYSSLNTDAIARSPLYFISLAEVNFLRAEGAIRGWDMGGSAEQFYNRGILSAFVEDPYDYENGWAEDGYKKYVEEYMQLDAPKPYVQKDPQDLGPDWPSQTKIGVKWNEGDDLETKLEKIITQKYIALFPNSLEAWADLRRTGYPKLFPVLNPDEGDGSLTIWETIRRIPWNSTDPIQQKYIQETGIPALGGEDLQATRLWWDVFGAGNF